MNDEWLDTEEIRARVAAEGSAELQRHWRLFERTGQSPPEVDADRLRRAAQRHIRAPGLLFLLVAASIGCLIGPALTTSAFADQAWPLTLLISVWAALHLGLIVLHLRTLLVRYVLWPQEQLIGRFLAIMLREKDYRSNWKTNDSVSKFEDLLAEMEGIYGHENWDSPDYVACYRKKDLAWEQTELDSPVARNHGVLREFLGYQDPDTRKFKPGRYVDSLTSGKASVTRFVKSHAEELKASRQGELSLNDSRKLLIALATEELEANSAGQEFLNAYLQQTEKAGIGNCHFLPAGNVTARIWQRDPWIDLTHQREFFSSASLRGVRWVGRGIKGRLGPFGYLENPAVSAIDFSDRSGRKVRVRIGICLVDGSVPVLFVDGIEGTNSLDPTLIQTALGDYARCCGLAAILFFARPHNQVPLYYLSAMAQDQKAFFKLQYLSSPGPQRAWYQHLYLDAFGWPIEPYEYALPTGNIECYYVEMMPGSVALPQRHASSWDRLRSWARHHVLWVLLSSALGHALVVTLLTVPLALIPLSIVAGLGIVAHLITNAKGLVKSRSRSS